MIQLPLRTIPVGVWHEILNRAIISGFGAFAREEEMKVSGAVICFAAAVLAAAGLYAHEEPVKTLKEKADRETTRIKMVKAGVRRISSYEVAVADGAKSLIAVQEFDGNGNILSLETFKGGTAEARLEYSYDGRGNISEQRTFMSPGKLVDRDVFEYDGEGRVVAGKTYDEKGRAIESFKYLHNPDRKKITFVKFKEGPETDYSIEYAYPDDYDKSGAAETVKFDTSGKTVLKVREDRDAAGRRTEKILFDKDFKETKRFRYEYDEAGNIIKVSAATPDKKGSFSETYLYNEKGLRVEEKEFSAGGVPVSVVRHEFEYQALHIGGEMKISEATPIAELSAHPEKWFNRDVRIEGVIASACTQEGCFIEVVPESGPGEGIVVNFADPDMKFPTDCAGKKVAVEGMFYQKVYPTSRLKHWQGHSFRKGKNIPEFSLVKRMIATSAEIKPEGAVPVPGEIFAADTGRIDLSMMEFETDGFGTGRKILNPGETTPEHSTGNVREMIFCLEGEVAIRLGEKRPFTLKAGEMSFIPEATMHELKNEGKSPCVYIFVYSKAEDKKREKGDHHH